MPQPPLYLGEKDKMLMPCLQWASLVSLVDGKRIQLREDELNPEEVPRPERMCRNLVLVDLMERWNNFTRQVVGHIGEMMQCKEQGTQWDSVNVVTFQRRWKFGGCQTYHLCLAHTCVIWLQN